jgi:hypothetical protein
LTCDATAYLKALLTDHLFILETNKVVCQDAKVKAADFVFRIFQIHRADYETWLGLAGGTSHVRKYGENDTTVRCSNRTHGWFVFVLRDFYTLP